MTSVQPVRCRSRHCPGRGAVPVLTAGRARSPSVFWGVTITTGTAKTSPKPEISCQGNKRACSGFGASHRQRCEGTGFAAGGGQPQPLHQGCCGQSAEPKAKELQGRRYTASTRRNEHPSFFQQGDKLLHGDKNHIDLEGAGTVGTRCSSSP